MAKENYHKTIGKLADKYSKALKSGDFEEAEQIKRAIELYSRFFDSQ